MGKSMFSSKQKSNRQVDLDEEVLEKKGSFLGKLNQPLFSNEKKDKDSASDETLTNKGKKPSFLSKFNQPLFSKKEKTDDVVLVEEDLPAKGEKRTSGSLFAPKKAKSRPAQVQKKVNQPYTMFGKPLKGNLVGIDIRDNEVRMAVAKQRRLDLEIIKTASMELPEGVVANGNIVDIDTLKALLSEMMAEYSINAKNAFFSIDHTNIIARPVTVPTSVNDEDLEGLLAFELQQYLDIDPSSYVIEYQETADAAPHQDDSRTLLVYAVPKGIVEKYLEIAEELKLVPYAFDLQSNTLKKWLNYVEAINNRAKHLTEKNVGMVQLSKNAVDVYLYSRGEFVTSNHHDGGYVQLMSLVDSAEALQDLATTASGSVEERLAKSSLDQWVSETRAHILNTENFFMTNTGEIVDTFYIFGNEKVCWHLTAILRDKLGRDVEFVDSADCEHITWDSSVNFSADFIPAVAMLIRRSN